MKRTLLAAVAALALFAATTALAADKYGVYVAPKLIYGYAMMDDVKLHGNYYGGLSGSGSGSAGKSRHDDTFGIGLALGYNFEAQFDMPLRVELEYALYDRVEGKASTGFDVTGGFYDRAEAKQKLDVQTLFFNAYFDIKTGTDITPYVGAGLGLAFIQSKASTRYDFDIGSHNYLTNRDSTSRKNDTNFAWNVGAGIGWRVTDILTLDLGYRFVSLGGTKSTSWESGQMSVRSKTEDLYMHQVALGLRCEF